MDTSRLFRLSSVSKFLMSHFESFIYRRWHHDSEFSLQTVSWHGFPRTDVVSQQQQSTAQQQSECRRCRPVRISAPQRSLPPLLWRFSLRISTFYPQSCGTQSRNSQAWMQKLQLQPTTSHDWIKYIRSLIVSWKEYIHSILKEVQWLFVYEEETSWMEVVKISSEVQF